MKKILLIFAILPFLFWGCFKRPAARTAMPKDVFLKLEGLWKGNFRVFDRNLKLIKESFVTIKYKMQGKKRLLGWAKEVDKSGKGINYETEQIINNNLIICNVKKANNSKKFLASFRAGAFVYMWSKGADLEISHEKVLGKKLFISGYVISSGKVFYISADYTKQD